MDYWKVLPVLAGVGGIVLIAAAIKLYFSQREGKCKGKKKSPVLLADYKVKYKLPLIEKEIINHNTRRFRFELPTPDHVLGIQTGQHIYLTIIVKPDFCVRSYTPISDNDDHGYVDLVVKIYPNGKMTQHLENMKIGDTIEVRGPAGRLIYLGKGSFKINKFRSKPPVEYTVKNIVMIAAGSGITPMLQLLKAISKDSNDVTKVSLLFANRTEDDILLRDSLEDYVKERPEQFKIWYTIDESVKDEEWPYSIGHINADMIKKNMLPPSPDTIVLMCGPDAMVSKFLPPLLDQVGYDSELRFAY